MALPGIDPTTVDGQMAIAAQQMMPGQGGAPAGPNPADLLPRTMSSTSSSSTVGNTSGETTGSSRGVETTQLSDEQRANLQQQDDLLHSQEVARTNLGLVQQMRATGQQLQAQDEAAARQAALQERAKLAAEADAELKRRQSEHDQLFTMYRAEAERGPRDFWANKTTGSKIAAAIGIALGAFSQGFRGGGPNTALDIINGAIERDFAQQRESLLRKEKALEGSRAGLTAYRQAVQERLQALDIKKAAAITSVTDKWAAKQAALGIPEAQIKANQDILALRTEAARLREKALAPTAQKISENLNKSITESENRSRTSGSQQGTVQVDARLAGGGNGPRPPTDAQVRANDLANRMIGDYETLTKVPPLSEEGREKMQEYAPLEEIYNKNDALKLAAIKMGIYKTPEQLLNDQDRKAYTAGRRLAQAALRGDSGSAISMGEYLGWDQQYLPQRGDKADDVALKRKAVYGIIEGKAQGSFRATELQQRLQPLEPTQGQQPSHSEPQMPSVDMSGMRVKLKDGRVGVLRGGNFYPE